MTTAPRPAHATPTTSHPASRSAKPWWIAAALVAVTGLLAAAVWTAANLVGIAARPTLFPRTTLPGSVPVVVAEDAPAVVYIETWDPRAVAQVTVTVSGPDGRPVLASRLDDPVQYDVPDQPGRLGHAGFAFTAPVSGTYLVSGTSAEADEAAALAVGSDLGEATLRGLLAPVILAAGMLILAAVLASTAMTRAGRHDR